MAYVQYQLRMAQGAADVVLRKQRSRFHWFAQHNRKVVKRDGVGCVADEDDDCKDSTAAAIDSGIVKSRYAGNAITIPVNAGQVRSRGELLAGRRQRVRLGAP